MIDSTGNVGIGTPSPSAFLHVSEPGSTTVPDALDVTGGAASGGQGGGISLLAGTSGANGSAVGFAGGSVTLTAGSGGTGNTTGAGGVLTLNGGTGASGNNGAKGGAVNINGGAGGSGSPDVGGPGGAGGNIVLTPGAGGSGASTGAKGTVVVSGNLTVNGTLSKTSGSFKIDHPLDPANKYLYHSFVESPDMMNIYNGNTVLDNRGRAWIRLPEWFGALNRDFRYQLTAVGAPGPNLYIAKEVEGNCFQIAGGKPGMKVSWQVTGIRQDPYADAHRIKVEEQKPEWEQGYYLHPELYGQPKEKGIEYAHETPHSQSPEIERATEAATRR